MVANSSNSSVPLLEARGLAWVAPGRKDPLWEDISFHLEVGQLTHLVGESGSGKSTLLRCLVLLEELRAGSIRWHGEVVDQDNIRRFRNQVVYVHQAPVAVAATVEENLDFPRQVGREFGDEQSIMCREEQREMLAYLGLENVNFSRRFDEFSLGEQQRLALVRCLTVRPRVLLLDEPTASLDDESARKVETYIKEKLVEKQGRAVIWVTHGVEQRRRLGGSVLDLGQWLL